MEDKKGIAQTVKTGIMNKVTKCVLDPLNETTDKTLTDITTTIGAFIIREIQGKFQRSISFTIGINYADKWMEEALYGILYQYNNIKACRQLQLTNDRKMTEGNGMYYQLEDGNHNLKYRDYHILLNISSTTPTSITGRTSVQRVYTIITYNLSQQFVKDFERDMIAHRNSLLKIRKDAPNVNVYQDLHESDGYTYWEKTDAIPKRRIGTIYLPADKKKMLVETINRFFAEKPMYRKHGVPHNLKILLYGPPGTGKDSIARMIASEWNRNLYYVRGGKEGRFIPDAITDSGEAVNYPLFLISDIDKYPYLINEPDVALDGDNAKDEKMKYKQLFGNMINALDGVMSGEDRIIIMTTNHIEKFSDTIVRPGRVDLKMEIGYVVPEVFRKYVWEFYKVALPTDIKLKDDNLTVARLQGDVMFMHLSSDEFIAKYVDFGKKKK